METLKIDDEMRNAIILAIRDQAKKDGTKLSGTDNEIWEKALKTSRSDPGAWNKLCKFYSDQKEDIQLGATVTATITAILVAILTALKK